ncbi:serine/threonine protein kinase [Opitutus terrae]|uniref:Serine/threonine protein kinase n=1 Tax=Opitutus terrae (strain DSM 11246 / JCM 15787 / PB90-1) TaxID=452637 RepID=B1ZUW2_OPITP|nr:serine/threonine-protein kinase [Opitutus terrae]ACB75932.1 serine/threonine protein kinase [Opitutus terrae PB90-1]
MSALKHIFNEIHYEMVRKIADGGMGVVYEAEQLGAGRFRKVVAVKLIREEYSAIEEFQRNFIGEARLVADLIHTNIVQTYHLGQVGGQYFMVMEYVRGVNLEQFIDRHRTVGRMVPIDIGAFIISRIARGLAYAHQKCDRESRHLNIVHRDIGPKNIMMAYEGDVKLTDFGIAKALDLMYNEEGKVIAGKDEYLSPEQANYAVTDSRADLFALGILLTEVLLGRNIFRAPERLQSRRNILTMSIPRFSTLRPEIDGRLEAIIQKALQRDRDKRYQTAFEMLNDLELYLYSDRYGPTNEKLGTYLKDLFGVIDPLPAPVGASAAAVAPASVEPVPAPPRVSLS